MAILLPENYELPRKNIVPRTIHDGKAYPTKTLVEEINAAEHGITLGKRWEGLAYGYVYLAGGVGAIDSYTPYQVSETSLSMWRIACEKAKGKGEPLPEYDDSRIVLCLYNKSLVRPKSYTAYRANAFNSSKHAKQQDRYRTNYDDTGIKFLTLQKGQMLRYLFPYELAWQGEVAAVAKGQSAEMGGRK